MAQTRKSLRIGHIAPDFDAETTRGTINFYDFIKGRWSILFAHPAQNPVSTTELAYFQFLVGEFDKRDVKLIALAPSTVAAANSWSEEIAKLATTPMTIPIIADETRKISLLYDMLDPAERAKGVVSTVRDIFIIDPYKMVRLIFSYPQNVGASVQEVIRVVDCLQTPDSVSTPAGWVPGQQVLVDPGAKAVEEVPIKDLNAIGEGVVLGTVQDV